MTKKGILRRAYEALVHQKPCGCNYLFACKSHSEACSRIELDLKERKPIELSNGERSIVLENPRKRVN